MLYKGNVSVEHWWYDTGSLKPKNCAMYAILSYGYDACLATLKNDTGKAKLS